MKYSTPLQPELTEELFQFWDPIFPGEPDFPRDLFLGSEVEHNRCDVYLERRNGTIVTTCDILYPLAIARLGGFGEVATSPQYRGEGLATEICRRALADFQSTGGEAIFLGTDNPSSARIYHRLGWRKIAGSNVMACISSGDSPEAFLVDYFRQPGTGTVRTAGPDLRVPIIPLLLTAHDWQILDANAGMYSTRYDVQVSCNGLYRRYRYVVQDGRGQWFAAATDDGRVVGLSTARLDESDQCSVDGFTHQLYTDCFSELIQEAIRWGRSHDAAAIYATLSAEDEDKQRLFQSLGFRKGQPGHDFELGGRKVKLVQFAAPDSVGPC